MSKKKKHYTLEEANAVLPKVKELAANIRGANEVRDEKQKEYARVMNAIAQNGGDFTERQLSQIMKTLARATRHLQKLMGELQTEFQCEVKGLEPLLVDFYSIRDGREIYLCWKEGEEDISHWHDLDAGFAGRQPL